MLKIRIKFTKTGDLKYIGHLDVMRFFQKLFMRANMPVAFSEGFSPHQLLSFSPPLALGAQSLGEYADVIMTDSVPSSEAVKRLNDQSVDGIKIISYKELPEKAENAMAAVRAAAYEITLKESESFGLNLCKEFEELMSQDTIIVTKNTKKNSADLDLKPLIYEYDIDYEHNSVYVTLSAGSINHVKPELLISSIFDKNCIAMPDNALEVLRRDLYTFDYNDNKLISLDEVGTDT